jgi:hypothetical protein
MTDREVFELKKGDTVYIASVREIGPWGFGPLFAVLFECVITCMRKDGSVDYKIVNVMVGGAKVDEKDARYLRPSNRAYPASRIFSRTPYGAMAGLHNAKLEQVREARKALAEAESKLALVAADPLLASVVYDEKQTEAK